MDIIKKLKEIRAEIEGWDDPTAPSSYRDLLGDAHYHLEECISYIKQIEQAETPDNCPKEKNVRDKT